MRRAFAITALFMLVVAVVSPVAATPDAARKQAPTVLVGLVTDIGPLADNGFNQYAWDGVKAGAKAIGARAAVVQTLSAEDYARNIQQLVDRDAALIVTVGFPMSTVTVEAAVANPGIQFVGIDQPIESGVPANYESLDFDAAGAGYLAGVVAASMSRSRIIGAVGGAEFVPAVLAYMNGYRNGATSVDPEISVQFAYAGSFQSADDGALAANGLIGLGADVIFAVAGQANAGVLEAACTAGVWGIGVDVDEYLVYPDLQGCIVTSAEKRVATATAGAIERWWSSGSPAVLPSGAFLNDASNSGIGLAPIRLPMHGAYEGLAGGTIDPCLPSTCDTTN